MDVYTQPVCPVILQNKTLQIVPTASKTLKYLGYNKYTVDVSG